MKTRNIKYCVLLLTYFIILPCLAQEEYYQKPYPSIGDTIPDYTFKDIVNFDNNQASISDFRGKWLILDYWSETCGSCIHSFPKMNDLYEHFKDQVGIIMIGIHNGKQDNTEILNSEQRTKGLYELLNKMHSLSLPVAFDNVLSKQHDVGALPHLLIINPQGVLIAKTLKIDSIQMKQLIAGEAVQFETALSRTEVEEKKVFYNEDLPVLTTGSLANGGIDTNFYYRSLLAPFDVKYTPHRQNLYFVNQRLKELAERDLKNGRIELRGVPIDNLYRSAFFGINSWEVYDPLHWKYSRKLLTKTSNKITEYEPEKQLYTYSLSIPKEKSSKELLIKSMQEDLERFFCYKAEVKMVRMPVVYLKIGDKAKIQELRNKTGITTYKNSEIIHQGFEETNMTMKSFMLSVAAWVDKAYKLPVYDKTGIDFNLDISVAGNFLDSQTGVRELERLGFKLVRGRKKLETIILTKGNN